MNVEDKIAELVEYDISVFKGMSAEDKIEFVEGLLTDRYNDNYLGEEISKLYDSIKGWLWIIV